MSDLFVYSDFLFECRWTMCLVPAVSSPSTFRSGNRRPSASNRFSRGPGGGGTSPVLACHDIGRWSFWISLFQHIIMALQFPSTMLENTPVTFMNCSQIWIVLSVSPRKFLRMLARSSPIRLTLGAGELRLTSLSTFSGRWFWVFQAGNNCTLCSVILSTASSTCRIHIWLPSSVVAPFIPVCPYSFSRSVISSSFTLAVPQRFISWVVCRYCRLSLHGCYITINFGLWHEYVLNLLQGECADLNITTSLRIHVTMGSGTLHCCAKLCLFDIINFWYLCRLIRMSIHVSVIGHLLLYCLYIFIFITQLRDEVFVFTECLGKAWCIQILHDPTAGIYTESCSNFIPHKVSIADSIPFAPKIDTVFEDLPACAHDGSRSIV